MTNDDFISEKYKTIQKKKWKREREICERKKKLFTNESNINSNKQPCLDHVRQMKKKKEIVKKFFKYKKRQTH